MTDIMMKLREQTREHHQRAESSALEKALVSGRISRETFAECLGQRHVVHCVLDACVRAVCAADPRLADLVPEELFQEANLRADLEFLGIDPQRIAPRPAATELAADIRSTSQRSPAAVLGHYYVFEGSKNGARYIARAVGAALGLRDGAGLRYLDPHGERQRELWAAFKRRMNAVEFTLAEQAGMIAAAQRTFDLVMRLDEEIHTGLNRADFAPALTAQQPKNATAGVYAGLPAR